MTDYTPTAEKVCGGYADGEWHYRQTPFVYSRAAFYRWLAAHDAEVRADERAAVEQRIAERIFNEEQVVNQTIWQDPLNPHLSGVLRGLQRARDLARGEDTLLHADDCDRALGCTCGTRTEIAHGEDKR